MFIFVYKHKIWILGTYSCAVQKIKVCWDDTLCSWVNSSWYFEVSNCLHLENYAVPEVCPTRCL